MKLTHDGPEGRLRNDEQRNPLEEPLAIAGEQHNLAIGTSRWRPYRDRLARLRQVAEAGQ